MGTFASSHAFDQSIFAFPVSQISRFNFPERFFAFL